MSDDNHLRIGKDKIDPLTDTAPEAGHVLFQRLSAACKDFPHEAVVNAAANLLLNVLRQRNESRGLAERDYNDMFGRLKSVLLAHYDGPTGKRRSVFPFHQVIRPDFISFRDKN